MRLSALTTMFNPPREVRPEEQRAFKKIEDVREAGGLTSIES
jgi:hypothetical protein